MSKRIDIKSILIIGSGPIIIGQGCEFDYSGVQACRALKEEGYRVILVNSNPATIMTDPAYSDATYIEPICWEEIAKIIAIERPDALLPTMGGQTALNSAMELEKRGILAKYNVELIGASVAAIEKAEDRQLFRETMIKIGLEVPRSHCVKSLNEAKEALKTLGFPSVLRPSFTLGGSGGGIAYNEQQFEEICSRGLELSPIQTVLIEESLLGWKEFELEVVRDKNDNCIIVCSIENIDPMGIHTGDSVTVAPAQTLTDKEYQRMRDAAIAILREIGVDTGGSNVQFAVEPKTGRMVVIEMNPRVSRSSALASKATGFPIAKVAAKLAIGYTLDELKNDVTGGAIPASFEPTIDYVVTKIPRFNFDKFKGTDTGLTTQMKSVGEAMALGRTFQESLQKALISLETKLTGLNSKCTSFLSASLSWGQKREKMTEALKHNGADRLLYVADAFRVGFTIEEVHNLTSIDPWFLNQVLELVHVETEVAGTSLQSLSLMPQVLLNWKRFGFSDARIAELMKVKEEELRQVRHDLDIRPVFKRIDSCAAEFPAKTAYLYSTYETFCEAYVTDKPKFMVLGSGPNRIGQGIEFDYCCVHALQALQEAGFETIMVNCNPETVSTDYDSSDRLYFEPLMLENVLEIIHLEKPKGVLVQYGGQTPLKLVQALTDAGIPILGTKADSIDMAEDRERFSKLIEELNLKQPEHGLARSVEEGKQIAAQLHFPLVMRPSYVLGGQAMRIVENEDELHAYLESAIFISEERPVLIDKYLENAIEVDVDSVSDGNQVFIGGILQHIEPAGVHSGDSTCVFPPYSLSKEIQETLCTQVEKLARGLSVIGPMNVQFAIKDNEIYVIEVNPRVSRTMPFVSKATGLPLIKVGVKCMLGISLQQQGLSSRYHPPYVSVKRSVFPFEKFPGANAELGPEMKSTGEVMGIARTFEMALLKSKKAAGENTTEKAPGKLTGKNTLEMGVDEEIYEKELTVSKLQNLHPLVQTMSDIQNNTKTTPKEAQSKKSAPLGVVT